VLILEIQKVLIIVLLIKVKENLVVNLCLYLFFKKKILMFIMRNYDCNNLIIVIVITNEIKKLGFSCYKYICKRITLSFSFK
jgi:hypothetical protein